MSRAAWLLTGKVAVAGLIISLAAFQIGIDQKIHRRDQSRAVQACDAGWEACRASTGLPVASVGGCVWRHRDPTYHATAFGKLGPNGRWIACKWTDEPDEEAEEDESSCGVGWRVCFGMVTKGGEAPAR